MTNVETSSEKPLVLRVGHCIYCNSTDDLRREHVIPFGIGGGVILLDASCPKCATITALIEDFVLRKNFGIFRAKHQFPTRRKKDRPTHSLLYKENSKETFEAPLADIPSVLHMPKIADVPGLVASTPREPGQIRIAGFVKCERVGDAAKATAKLGNFDMETEFYSDQFFRMLAKIAHGLVTTMYDSGKMRPLLLSLIFEGGMKGNLAKADALVGDSDVEL